MLRVEKLVRKFGHGELEMIALKSLDLEIKDGEFVAIIGPSGAGKSTLLYQLSLLDHPTEGEIYVDGRKTSTLNSREKTALRLNVFGYVFQDYALLPELTAAENVCLPMLMQGMSRPQALKKAEETLKRVGLGDKLRNLPSQLSGGQQQRVSIARAIAHAPKVLFADEPTANLDSENAKLVIDSFLDLHRLSHQTIVMVTHEDEYAHKADRIIKMRDGSIVTDSRN